MKSKRTAIIMDLDNVIIDSWHPSFASEFAVGKFDRFERLIPTYPANAWAVALVNALSREHRILFVTARNEEYRAATVEWLDKHLDTTNLFQTDLYMRPTGDSRPDHVIKSELFEKFNRKYTILLAIDDNLDNCRLWNSLGITALTNNIPGEVKLEGDL